MTIFCRFFLSRGTKKLRRRTLLCLKKVLVSNFFCRSFYVPQYRKTSLRNVSVLCFRKIPFEKKLVDKMGGGWGAREYHGFLSKLIFLSAPKKCVAEPFSVSLKLCGKKFYA